MLKNNKHVRRLAIICVIGFKMLVLNGAESPPEVNIGERLFLETRFAQFFWLHSIDLNEELEKGDPILDYTLTMEEKIAGEFRGRSINCRVCHLVDEHAGMGDLSDSQRSRIRAYNDFAQRSPIPDRNDGRFTTLRNSPSIVGSGLSDLFHYDGEFETLEDLILKTFCGRNFGWLPSEMLQAKAHIINVIKNDDGNYGLSRRFGGSYRDVLKGSAAVPEEFRLQFPFSIDIDFASDGEILEAISELVAHYVRDLSFISNNDVEPVESPYDIFLRLNSLPTAPLKDESTLSYARRLRKELNSVLSPVFVSKNDYSFKFHDQDYVFGENEMNGLIVFLSESGTLDLQKGTGGIGNCIACHSPPNFSDFNFHNTGVSQEEYDFIHGDGAFCEIEIPEIDSSIKSNGRNSEIDMQDLVLWEGQFSVIPSLDRPGYTDLGVWNVLLKSFYDTTQTKIRNFLLRENPGLSDKDLLRRSVAAFKTPGLRDLGHSSPYFHTGRFESLEEVVHFYMSISERARKGTVRNADVELSEIYLNRNDVALLTAFLRSLNEDYE